jgi:hypothetical protein
VSGNTWEKCVFPILSLKQELAAGDWEVSQFGGGLDLKSGRGEVWYKNGLRLGESIISSQL